MRDVVVILREIRDLLLEILKAVKGDVTKEGEEDPPPKPPGEPG